MRRKTVKKAVLRFSPRLCGEKYENFNDCARAVFSAARHAIQRISPLESPLEIGASRGFTHLPSRRRRANRACQHLPLAETPLHLERENRPLCGENIFRHSAFCASLPHDVERQIRLRPHARRSGLGGRAAAQILGLSACVRHALQPAGADEQFRHQQFADAVSHRRSHRALGVETFAENDCDLPVSRRARREIAPQSAVSRD